MRITSALMMIAVMSALSGCASWISVKPVAGDPKVKGLRYSLATPYLLVKPKSDGTVAYEWLYLPDASKQYAITKHSMLSTNSLEISLEHGILTKIVGKPDSSAAAATALTQAGAVLAAGETAGKKASDAKETAAKAEIDKLKTAVATAEADRRTAELAFEKATAKHTFLKDQKPPDEKLVAEAALALKLTEIDLKAAEEELARVGVILAASGSTNGGANTANTNSELGHLRPLLFRVVQGANGGVTLQAVHDPAVFPDYSQVLASGAGGGLKFAAVWDAEAKALIVEATKDVQILANRIQLNLAGNPVQAEATIDPAVKDAKRFKISFNPALVAGKYEMQFEYKLGGANPKGKTAFEVK